MDTLRQDVRIGLRQLLRHRGLTLAAAVSLGLGIGANAAIFSVVSAVFLSPLPGAETGRVVAVYRTFQQAGNTAGGFLGAGLLPISYPNFVDVRDRARTLDALVAEGFASFNLAGEGAPEQVFGGTVSAAYFETLGLRPAAGRFFRAEEDATRGTHPVVVLGHGLWQRRFAGDAALVGREIRLNGRAFTVVGVAPEGFQGVGTLSAAQLWVPAAMAEAIVNSPGIFGQLLDHRGIRAFNAWGRLAPGATLEQAQAELAGIAARLAEEHPEWNRDRGIFLEPLSEARLPPALRGDAFRAGAVLMTAVGLVLLIACANVASLLLAHATGRGREIAMRLALGASRGRLVRQLLTESLLLWVVGGLAGLLLAYWTRPLLWSFRPPFVLEDALELAIDARVLAFSFGVTALTGMLFGLVPALRASRADLVDALRQRGAGGGGGGTGLRQLLVGGQVALSLVALVAAGFFVQSLSNAREIDPGYEVGRLALFDFDTAARGLDPERAARFREDLLLGVENLPGVERAALSSHRPLTGAGSRRILIPDAEETVGPNGLYITVGSVSPGYFETLGIPAVEGRILDASDRDGRPVAVVNETMARRFWPEGSPVGRPLRYPGDDEAFEIVGVVRDVKYATLGEDPVPYIYRPLSQEFASALTLHVSSTGAPGVLVQPVLAAMREIDPELAVTDAAVMSEALNRSLWGATTSAAFLGAFALVALLLAATGIHGVVSQMVQQRRYEMGIRIALGARASEVAALVVRQGMTPVLLGLAVGGALAAATTHLLARLLYGLSGTELAIFVLAAGVLCAVAVLACLVPARAATRVDPMLTLRDG